MSTTIAGYCRGYDPSYDLLNYSSRDDGVVTFAKFKDTRSTLRLKSNVVNLSLCGGQQFGTMLAVYMQKGCLTVYIKPCTYIRVSK